MSDRVSTVDFWTTYQPGFRFTTEEPGSPAFFEAVERHRYELEPHIAEMARFEEWAGRDVLDVGCGVGTDGAQFVRAGARYTGVDRSPAALDLARRRFELDGADARIVEASATALPFDDNSFDLVWSHGVIHHVPDTEAAVAEFRRVLRAGGVAIVMLYHRQSMNYAVTILGARRALAAALIVPRGVDIVARATGESRDVLAGHRELLRQHGVRYLTDRALFLSNNTDGPGNPLSKVYSSGEARRLFEDWSSVETTVRYLNARLYPGGSRFEKTAAGRGLAARFGWHLYVRGVK